MRTSARNVVCLLFEQFELLDLAGFTQVLSLAGRHWNWRPFNIVLYCPVARSCLSTSQIALECVTEIVVDVDVLFLAGGQRAETAASDRQTTSIVSSLCNQAEVVVSVQQGTVLLAASGQLAGHKVAVQTREHSAVARQDPTVKLSSQMVASSGKFLTASSSRASIDLGIELIKKLLGDKLAYKVAHEVGAAPVHPLALTFK